MKSNEPVLAQIVSIILHPLLMVVYIICFLFIYTDFSFIYSGQFFSFFIPVLFLSCIAPAMAVILLKEFGFVSDYDVQDRNERFLPILSTIFCNAILIYYFSISGVYLWFVALMIAPTLTLIVCGIITYFWKISIHMVGIGGLIGSILAVCYNVKGINPYYLFIILFILAGCLGVSRLILNRHTPAQVLVGFVVGLAISYLCVWSVVHFQFF